MAYLWIRPALLLLLLLSLLLLCPSKSQNSQLNSTVLPDTSFTQQQPFYIKIKEGDSKSINLNQITQNWNQAFDFEGQYPDFCYKQKGILYTRQEQYPLDVQNKTAINRVQSISVNNRNGIIFTFIQDKQGIFSHKFNHTLRKFQQLNHIKDNSLTRVSVKTSKILYNDNSQTLVILTTKSLVLFELSGSESQAKFKFQLTGLFTENQMMSMKKVKIITYGSNIIAFNVNTSVVVVDIQTKQNKRYDFMQKIVDMTIELANKKAFLILLIQNKGVEISDFRQIHTAFVSGQVQFQPTKSSTLTQDQKAKLGDKLIEIDSNGQRIIAVIQDVSSSNGQLPFFIEYYVQDDFSFKTVSTGYYARYYQNQQQATTLLMSKSYSLIWADDVGYIFPLSLGVSHQYVQTYRSQKLNALTIYQPASSHDTYILGELQQGVILQKVQYSAPWLLCNLQKRRGGRRLQQQSENDDDDDDDDDNSGGGRGKYNFSLKVFGKTCQSQKQNTIDPFVVCSRDYDVRIRVVDDDHSSYSKVVVAVSIMLGIILVVGIIVLIVLILRCKKQRRLARNYEELSRRREFQALEQNNQEQVQMGNIGIFDGFERAAVREFDDKNQQLYPSQQLQSRQQAENLDKVNRLQTEED